MSAGQDPVAIARIMQTDAVRQKLQVDQMRRKLAPGSTEEQRLKESCDGFEAIFLGKLWQQMRKTVDKDGYLHSKEEEAYVGLFDQEMSMKMARAGGMGLGEQLFEQLKQRLTEAGSITQSISRGNGPAEPLPLHPDASARDLRLRPDPSALNQPSRQAAHVPDQAAAMAADLARRIVEEHGIQGNAFGDISGDALGEILDQASYEDVPPDGDAE